MKATELVVLSTFRSVTDAQIAKGILDAVEINPPSGRITLVACIPRSIRQTCW